MSSKATNDENGDDVPDLDDFSDVFANMKTTNFEQKGDKNKPFIGDYATPKPDPLEAKPPSDSGNIQGKEIAREVKDAKKEEGSFGGFKKGFFSKSNEPKKAAKPAAGLKEKPEEKKEEIVTLKANKDEAKKNKLEIQEVQEAMKAKNFLQDNKNSWLTPELLEKVSQNPSILKMFTNPEYMKAIGMMQTKPKEAMEIYGKNPEFVQIFQEFCKVMGTHFTDVAEKEKNTQSAPSDQIKDPEIDEILKDPKIRAILEYLQKNQKADFHQIKRSDPTVAAKMDVLIKKGYIKLQSY